MPFRSMTGSRPIKGSELSTIFVGINDFDTSREPSPHDEERTGEVTCGRKGERDARRA
jgi:hypothetical protein